VTTSMPMDSPPATRALSPAGRSGRAPTARAGPSACLGLPGRFERDPADSRPPLPRQRPRPPGQEPRGRPARGRVSRAGPCPGPPRCRRGLAGRARAVGQRPRTDAQEGRANGGGAPAPHRRGGAGAHPGSGRRWRWPADAQRGVQLPREARRGGGPARGGARPLRRGSTGHPGAGAAAS